MFGIDFNVLIIACLIGVAVLALCYSLLYTKVQEENNQERRVKKLKGGVADRNAKIVAEARLADNNKRKNAVQSQLKELEKSTKDRNPNKVGLKELIRQSGMKFSVKQFYLGSVIFGIIFSIATFIYLGNMLVAFAALIIGTLGIPRWFISFKKKRRINAFLNEFPNAVDVIVRGIKAGLPLNDCIGIIASEANEPVKSEFKKVLETQQMGVPMPEAIIKLYKSVPIAEVNFFGLVIGIQQSSGGNLSEALSNLSGVLRDRKKMKAKISAMSQEAKSSAAIIGSLPFIVSGLIHLSSPDYLTPLFTTSTGTIILVGSAIWMSMGIIVMKTMINFDF